jgi:putative transposase
VATAAIKKKRFYGFWASRKKVSQVHPKGVLPLTPQVFSALIKIVMPRRREILVKGEIYHVYNRSSNLQDILVKDRDIRRFIDLLDFYRLPRKLRYSKFSLLSVERRKAFIEEADKEGKYVSLFAYALMPDHYHLLLRQEAENGISIFISRLQNAFAKYFNLKYKKRGSLFINPFKARRITSEEIFKHVSRYIHLNPVTSYLVEIDRLGSFINTSYPYYLYDTEDSLIDTQYLLTMFGGRNQYKKFVENNADYQRRLGKIKKFLME